MRYLSYHLSMALAVLLLPVVAVIPYIFYSKGFQVITWVWEVGYQPFWWHINFAILGAIISGVFLFRFHPLGKTFYSITTLLVTAGSSIFAMSEHQHILLAVIFLLAMALVLVGEWIQKTLSLPYYNSKCAWWEKYPKAIPRVTACVYDKQGSENFEKVRLVNLGEQGCFVFLLNKAWTFKPQYIELSFRDQHTFHATVETRLQTKNKAGIGLKFTNKNCGDWAKDLQNYLNEIRRAGYVSN